MVDNLSKDEFFSEEMSIEDCFEMSLSRLIDIFSPDRPFISCSWALLSSVGFLVGIISADDVSKEESCW